MRRCQDCTTGFFKDVHGIGGPAGKAIIFADQFDSMQNAIDYLPADGGTILLPPGYTENIPTGITFSKDNVALICPTRDAVLVDDAPGTLYGIIEGLDGVTERSDITLYGITFDCSKHATASRGINFHYNANTPFYRWLISHCYFYSGAHAIYGNGTGGGLGKSFTDSTIEHCRMFAVQHGISALGFQRVKIRDIYADGNYTTYRQLIVFTTDRMVVTDYHVRRTNNEGFNIGADLGTGVPPEFIRSTSELSKGPGFRIQGGSGTEARAKLRECKAIDNNYLDSGVDSGYLVGQYTNRVSLTDCGGYVKNRNEQRYGFDIEAGASKCEVRGGRWSPNKTASWLDNGTDTIIDARDD